MDCLFTWSLIGAIIVIAILVVICFYASLKDTYNIHCILLKSEYSLILDALSFSWVKKRQQQHRHTVSSYIIPYDRILYYITPLYSFYNNDEPC